MYDLIDRTKTFAVAIRSHISTYKFNPLLIDDFKQIVRSSGSIGANYIEANQTLGDKDFKLRIKIAKKEAKETSYWSGILFEITGDTKFNDFLNESTQLELILGSILKNYKSTR